MSDKFSWQLTHEIAGVQLASLYAGVRSARKDDLALFKIAANSSVAAVFTQNRFAAAPVHICRQKLSAIDTTEAVYLLINAGNANAATGSTGYDSAAACTQALASITGVKDGQVLPFSTGVIGEPLDHKKILEVLPKLVDQLDGSLASWQNAARAIMTTDTLAKGLSVEINTSQGPIRIAGIAKGAGMICPNMGTMLSYVTTDAKISKVDLQKFLIQACHKSFNRITIDGDTSTNDSFVMAATGASDVDVSYGTDLGEQFSKALTALSFKLAKMIVLDGEGATKCVAIKVCAAGSQQECLDVAYAIAHSPLVKTALFASDPNWGRIVAAVGYAGIEDLDPEKVNIALYPKGDVENGFDAQKVQIVERGGRAASYLEEQGQAVFDLPEFTIEVSLGRGSFSETLITSDLSHDYVRINAEYRT